MDPKLSGLDPKLREAYERVMNGPSASSGASTPPSNPAQSLPQQPGSVSPPPPEVQTPVPEPAPAPLVSPTPPLAPAPASNNFAFNSNYQSNQSTTTTVKKAGGKLSSILIILGLVVLLVAYTFVWVYLFKLKIPFLPF